MLSRLKNPDVGPLLVLTIPSLIALGSFAYLGSLSRFIADDYCVAYYAQRLGLLRSIWYWYIGWGGTFSTSIVDWLLVLVGARRISYVTPTVLLIWLVIAVAAVGLALPRNVRVRRRMITAAALGPVAIFVTLLISPDVPQSLYWWTGMRSYTLPVVISTLYIAVFQLYRRRKSKGRPLLWCIFSFLIIFINGGFSESLSPVQVVFIVGVLGIGLVAGKIDFGDNTFWFLGAALLGALASLALVLAAPGNTNRQAFYPAAPGILALFQISLGAYFSFLLDILREPQKIIGLLGMMLGAVWLGMGIGAAARRTLWIPLVMILCGFVLAFGCFIPAAWGMSEAPPARILIIPAFFIVTGCLAGAFLVGDFLAGQNGLTVSRVFRVALAMVTLLCLGVSVGFSVRSVYSARQSFIDYANKWDAVDAQIIAARRAGSQVVHIPTMDSWTSLDVPNDNPKYWLTICYSKYYDIQVFSP